MKTLVGGIMLSSKQVGPFRKVIGFHLSRKREVGSKILENVVIRTVGLGGGSKKYIETLIFLCCPQKFNKELLTVCVIWRH